MGIERFYKPITVNTVSVNDVDAEGNRDNTETLKGISEGYIYEDSGSKSYYQSQNQNQAECNLLTYATSTISINDVVVQNGVRYRVTGPKISYDNSLNHAEYKLLRLESNV